MKYNHLLDRVESELYSQHSGRPRQADLKRLVSTMYYALFHALIETGSHLISPDVVRSLVLRCYSHKNMKDVSRKFSETANLQNLPDKIGIIVRSSPQDLQDIARLFVSLQQSRHDADYNYDSVFTKHEVIALYSELKDLLGKWPMTSKDMAAKIYLIGMLLPDILRRHHS